jgi:O-Antigen ligase
MTPPPTERLAMTKLAAANAPSPTVDAPGATRAPVTTPLPPASEETHAAPGRDDAAGTRLGRLTVTALMLLPGALIVFMGFNAGGNFPDAPAIAALVLAQLLLLRIMQVRRPFEGLAPATLAALAALAVYAALTLASALWSHALGRALIELDRAWLYLLILLLFGTLHASTPQLRWLIRGLAIGISVVCLAGLISRVLPDVWHTAPDVANERLSYPVTYWNALGALAALGVVFTLHLTCTLAERRLVRVLAAGALPLLAATLFFTFSRGAIAACAVGLVAYVLVARPRGLASGLIATAPTTGALLVVAYHAKLLDTVDPTTPAAVSEGHHVALVAGICAVVAAGVRLFLAGTLDPLLFRAASRTWISSRAKRAVLASVLALAAVALVGLGVPQSLEHDWQRFISGAGPQQRHGDFRQRLTDPSNDGRTPLWRAALDEFSVSPLQGAGAGMYQTVWDQRRPYESYVVNAHSLYFQAMAELGAPGLLALLVLVGAVFWGLAARARRSRRSLYGVLLAAGVVWALHAGVDWDWEMPVVTLAFFATAGAALSPRRDRIPGKRRWWGKRRARVERQTAGRLREWAPSSGPRLALCVLCLASAALPVVIIGSQTRLDSAEHALYASPRNCAQASAQAQSSIGWLNVRSEPYEVLGFCDLRRGLPRLGVTAMEQAVRNDPGSWEAYYGLALAKASAGIDPRADAGKALRMNPLEPLTRQAALQLRGSSRREWVSRAPSLRAAALASNDLALVPS